MTMNKNPSSPSAPSPVASAPRGQGSTKGVDPKASMSQDADQDSTLKYITLFGVAAVVISLGIGGYYLYNHFSNKKMEKELSQIYQFQTGPLKKFQEKKSTSDDFLKEWEKLQKDLQGNERLGTLALELTVPLAQEKKWEQIIGILSPLLMQFKSNLYLSYLLSINLATTYEDAGKGKEAIDLLEDLLKKDAKFLQPKIYFDLGRLYSKEGNKEKAKVNLQYVVDNFPDDRMAHLSRIYLQKL